MADIDFEELDKAVNNLMSNVDTSKRPDGLDDPEDTVLTVPETESQDVPEATPTVETTSEVNDEDDTAHATEEPVADTSDDTPVSSSLAMKRRGQFMDIVHPSRDMTNNPSKSVNHQGVTLQPSIDGITAPSTPTAAVSTAEDAPEAVGDQPANEATAASSWPDPIDVAAVPEDTADTERSLDTAPDAEVIEAPNEPEPLSSPFLPDAKPEKRPLGGLTDTAPTVTAASMASPVNSEVLPEEFSGDIMAVESRDLSSHTGEVQDETSAVPAEVKSVDSTPQPQPEVPTEPAPRDAQPSAGGSITQQYTEQSSSGDQTNGSIYDTATYHQAITDAQPTKKKSPVLTWIVWIIVLLLVGATAGAAYFYFTR